MRIAIVGAGQAARGWGRVLGQAGHSISGVWARRASSARAAAEFIGAREVREDLRSAAAQAEVVFLCVPDDAIRGVAQGLHAGPEIVVAHVSGVHSAEVLEPHPLRGAVHPLRSFADPASAAREFAGTYCAVDGVPRATPILEGLVRSAGGHPLTLASDRKALYHAGGVFASNYVVAVFEMAVRLLEAAGVGRKEAHECLCPLLAGTASNLARMEVPDALSGPIERGDAETVRLHLDALRAFSPDARELYGRLGEVACALAEKKGGVSARALDLIRSLIRPESAE